MKWQAATIIIRINTGDFAIINNVRTSEFTSKVVVVDR